MHFLKVFHNLIISIDVLSPFGDVSSEFKWFLLQKASATVMKRKRVSAIFLLVVLYLVVGAVVFKSLEQPHER